MALNGISGLSTKQLKQNAKLSAAATKRSADGRPSTLDTSLLPSVYTNNTVTTQSHPSGLAQGRPWTIGPPPPSYSVAPRASSINEGTGLGTVFDITTTNVVDGTTLYYTVTGNVTGADFASGSLPSGSFTINSDAGTVSFDLKADALTEGSENYALQIRTGSVTGTVVATSNTVTINDTSLTPTYAFGTIPTSIDEGSAGTFNVTTTNVSNGTTLYWTVATNSGDFGTTSGSFTITSNAGSFTVTPTADSTTEGSETFTVALRTVSTSGTVVATTGTVTINDTSTFTPLANPVELATNSDFTNGTTGWTAGGGFGTYSYTSSNQVALYNGELYFTFQLRTVSQTMDVSSVIANTASFTATVNIRHQEKGGAATYTQVDTYTFTVVFKNSSGATVTTKTTGLSNAPQNATDVDLTLNRSEIPATFGTITSAVVSVSGIDSGYWNGNHGPIVKYITLTAS
jgi:hypothetical protein